MAKPRVWLIAQLEKSDKLTAHSFNVAGPPLFRGHLKIIGTFIAETQRKQRIRRKEDKRLSKRRGERRGGSV